MASTLVDIVDATPIDRIADELYALPPAEFVAARDAAAKRAGDRGDKALAKQVSALRKPTLSAWALNQLARQHAAEYAQALALGDQLRTAQEQLKGSVLRELSGRRRVVVSALVRLAEDLARDAGTPLGPDAVQQVRTTLTAALADAVLAARIRAGRLVKPVEQSGFGPLSETAVPAPAARDDLAPRREKKRERELSKARDDIKAAKAAAREASAALAEAEAVLTAREERTEELRAELRRAQQAEHEAATKAERARRKASTAQEKLAAAQARMSSLREEG
ncbi:hypothetical protein [Saccharothrix variisporea]|uniref:Uncharacterized protein n=1 Tax=Saccharothrix variisporea TaxID=543527 RepID=A0A495XIF7_9PSEU|nr:hypothetical protein [Saccharothrix variisporea]RKT72554.1 hypothetical protein DFJ66_5869 [Saccharothrix variisporea]